jgi:hypothetical protein
MLEGTTATKAEAMPTMQLKNALPGCSWVALPSTGGVMAGDAPRRRVWAIRPTNHRFLATESTLQNIGHPHEYWLCGVNIAC